MISRRARITVTATVAGLGALAGVAVESNHGLPATTVATINGHEIVTGASGSVGTAENAAAPAGRAPIVTRASGATAAVGPSRIDDD